MGNKVGRSYKLRTVQVPPGGGGKTFKVVACDAADISNGQMKEVPLPGDQKALLIKAKDGQLCAIGGTCTHYGAPLVKGVLHNGRVRCPWHGACFNTSTGDIEDFPGLDSLPKYNAVVENGKVFIHGTEQKSAKRVKAMAPRNKRQTDLFLLIGTGPCALKCAETLRQEGFQGRIVMVTQENHPPYDRPKLSKALDSPADKLYLRGLDFLSNNDIEVMTGCEIVKLQTSANIVESQRGKTLNYTKLLIATGGTPRTLEVPGSNLKNIFYLRTPEDANAIKEKATGRKVLIVGTSFIGMEVAAYLADKAESVTVVGSTEVPFERVFGKEIGKVMQKLCESKGIKFYGKQHVAKFEGDDGALKSAHLKDGTKIPADVCVVGAGVVPSTKFLSDHKPSINMNSAGQIIVDEGMRTNVSNVFAGGDIVMFPLFINANNSSNIQHWQMAHQHGKIAALNMLGKKIAVKSVPYFWTVLFGKSVRYCGYGPGFDDVVIHGNLEELSFVAFYTKGEAVVAVASLNFDPIVSQAAQVMLSGKTITKTQVKESAKSWLNALD